MNVESINAVCGIAIVQRIFGPGPTEGSNHIKLQTAGGPDSLFQRVILMKNIYYDSKRFHFHKNDSMHFRIRYDEKTDWHRIEFASLGSECLLCRSIRKHCDLSFKRDL
ncbi:Hypothetical predicted protein [Mytilus galloprovincialis]|uniref:Uncharacterized protein n=1 Tax=Mytilus galloprovincialis TaxID=29158 RepID=A0A8B6FKW2_MYTGA|nr:Hypothetical predicted protein [Mytilus galloprovincialis]